MEDVFEKPRLTAADEVHNLVAIPRADNCFFPAILGKNVQVSFNGDAVRADSKVIQQSRHVEVRRDLLQLSIHSNLNYFTGC